MLNDLSLTGKLLNMGWYRGSYRYDTPKEENIFALGDVPARYYSEVVLQLLKATASSTETDASWREKVWK